MNNILNNLNYKTLVSFDYFFFYIRDVYLIELYFKKLPSKNSINTIKNTDNLIESNLINIEILNSIVP